MSQTPRGIGISTVSASNIRNEFDDTGDVSMRDYRGGYGFQGNRPINYSDFWGAVGLQVGVDPSGDLCGFLHPAAPPEGAFGALPGGISTVSISNGYHLLVYAFLEYNLKGNICYIIMLYGSFSENDSISFSINGGPRLTCQAIPGTATFGYFMAVADWKEPVLAPFAGQGSVRLTFNFV